MTLEEFVTKWNNKGLDFDGVYGDQCMDLMHQYCVEVLGITDGRVLAAPAAKDVYNNFSSVFGNQYFDQIANTPTGVPQKGDIMLWGTGVGAYGHVAVFIEGDANAFKSFDQNWPLNSNCHIQDHSYNGVLGWLRFKAPINTQAIIDELRTQRDNNHNETIAEIAKNTELTKKVTELESELSKANTDAKNYLDQLAKAKADDSNLGIRNLALSTENDSLKGDLHTLYSALQVATTTDALSKIDQLLKPDEKAVSEYEKLGLALEEFFYKKAPKAKPFLKKIADKLLFWFR